MMTNKFTITFRELPWVGARKPYYLAHCKELDLEAYGHTKEEAYDEISKIIPDHFGWLYRNVKDLSPFFKEQFKYRDYVMPEGGK